MSSFDAEGFLSWIDDQDGYYVRDDEVREEWPAFYDNFSLLGVTMTTDDEGNTLVPKRDYRGCVLYGQPLD